MLRKLFRRWRRDEDGATAVEFALVSVLFFVCLFAFIELTRILWIWNSAQSCISKGARYYLTHKSTSDSDLEAYINAALTSVQIDSSMVDITITKSTVSGINFIQIDGDMTVPLFGYIGGNNGNISLTVTTRLPVDSST